MTTKLTPEKRKQLESVNRKVNRDVRYKSDARLYERTDFWTVAENEGDCEDYALAKRRALVSLGWDRSDLLLTTCWDELGEYHGVLVVVTDEGDLVLDNRQTSVTPWLKLLKIGYNFHLRESPTRRQWDLISDGKPDT